MAWMMPRRHDAWYFDQCFAEEIVEQQVRQFGFLS